MKFPKLFFSLFLIFALNNNSYSQSGVDIINSIIGMIMNGGFYNQTLKSSPNTVNGVLPNHEYDMLYANYNNTKISNFSVAGTSYINSSMFDTVIVRRAANNWINSTENKQNIFCQGPAVLDNTNSFVSFPIGYPSTSNQNFMERVIKNGYINIGSDNVFNNDSTSDLTYNNIERVDLVIKNGVVTNNIAKAGFLITERGGNDPFKIAAITAIDANGNPTAFGIVKSIPVTAYGTSFLNINTYVLRKDIGDNQLRMFSKVVAQDVKGIFITFSDLGVNPNQKIYGYALMANDVTAVTSSEVLDFTNTTKFPRNTNTLNGGMDMASAPGFFKENVVLASKDIQFTFTKVNCNVNLNWSDENWNNVKEYQLEKAIADNNFIKLTTINANQKNTTFVDDKANLNCFYRLKVTEKNGEIYYSSILNFNKACNTVAVSLFPNPVHNKVNIVSGKENRIANATIVSFSGTTLQNWNFSNPNQNVQLDITTLSAGSYIIKVKDENGNITNHSIIKK